MNDWTIPIQFAAAVTNFAGWLWGPSTFYPMVPQLVVGKVMEREDNSLPLSVEDEDIPQLLHTWWFAGATSTFGV
jgi:hypothetical protein